MVREMTLSVSATRSETTFETDDDLTDELVAEKKKSMEGEV